jgi:hypothetical protein
MAGNVIGLMGALPRMMPALLARGWRKNYYLPVGVADF